MKYYSTKKGSPLVSAKTAVLNGLAADGGLYLPETIPTLPNNFFNNLSKLSFTEIGLEIAYPFLTQDISKNDLRLLIEDALNFEAPLIELSDNIYALELFHGPTLAFKDFGARFMSRLMGFFLKDTKEEVTILVATSGDTGSAVANGFYQVPGIRVILLYPSAMVSDLQEKQFTTLGGNITAIELDGTFDDCQALVKQAFLDSDLKENLTLASANSINIARLIPQAFYYCYAYGQAKSLNSKLPIVFSVPSGNFGNLTAGLIAKRMGLPVDKFVAATNINDIVPNYIATGIFQPKLSQSTLSNAMDVGNPSNFARLLELSQGDIDKIRTDIFAASFTDQQTIEMLKKIYTSTGYMLDPHGAVGLLGLDQYKQTTKTDFFGIFLETAHPAKFRETVESSLGIKIKLPPSLNQLANKTKQSFFMANNYSKFKELIINKS